MRRPLVELSDDELHREAHAIANEQDRRYLLRVEKWRNDPDRVGCQAGHDGECNWEHCPQTIDGEPEKSGRHCPRDTRKDEDET